MEESMTFKSPEIPLKVKDLFENIVADEKPESPVNVEAIARSLGVEISYEQMLCDGSIEKIGENKYIIKVNIMSNRLRQRFTIAHEIAHLIIRTVKRYQLINLLNDVFEPDQTINFDHYNDERLCDLISSLILVPPVIAKQFTDWRTLSIKKLAKGSREWQVSISTFLWSVLAFAQYEGGFIWYKTKISQDDTNNIQLTYCWSKFPKSRRIDIPETVFFRISNADNLRYSLLDFSSNEERFHPRVKFEFEGLSEYHAVRIKVFGKGKEKKVLVLVYPREIKADFVQSKTSLQRTII